MQNPVHTRLIIVLATAVVTGIIVQGYLAHQQRRRQIAEHRYRQLYDQGAAVLETLQTAYRDLHFLFRTRAALTPSELEPRYTTLHTALESYRLYLHQLERVGTSGQVQAVSHVYTWGVGVAAAFTEQYRLAEQVQHHVEDLLQVDNPESGRFTVLDAAVEADLDRLIHNENRVFYVTGEHTQAVLEGLKQAVHHEFRAALGIDLPADTAQARSARTAGASARPAAARHSNRVSQRLTPRTGSIVEPLCATDCSSVNTLTMRFHLVISLCTCHVSGERTAFFPHSKRGAR